MNGNDLGVLVGFVIVVTVLIIQWARGAFKDDDPPFTHGGYA